MPMAVVLPIFFYMCGFRWRTPESCQKNLQQRKADTAAYGVYFKNCHFDLLSDVKNVGDGGDPLPGELRDVKQSVFLDSEVYESAEGGYVGHNSRYFGAGAEIFEFFNCRPEGSSGVVGARIASRFSEFGDNIAYSLQSADSFSGERGRIDFIQQSRISGQIGSLCSEPAGYHLHDTVALGMDSGVVEGLRSTRNPEESGSLLECFGA